MTLKSKKKTSSADARANKLALAKTLLARCDAQEDFPKFSEGTLPVQFNSNSLRSNTEVIIEMGEQLWMRGFADNRVNHAAAHAYTPVLADDENDHELLYTATKTDADRSRTECDASIDVDRSSSLLGTGMLGRVNASSKATDALIVLENTNITQTLKSLRKRANSNTGDETVGSIQDRNCIDDKCGQPCSAAEGFLKSSADTKESRVESRRYGKTPKVLKISKASAARPLPYSPDFTQHILIEKLRGGKDTATPYIRHAIHSRLRATKGALGKRLPVLDQDPEQKDAEQRGISSEASRPRDNNVISMESLARSTEAILQAYKKLRDMEAAVGGQLNELVEKNGKAEELWSNYADLLWMHSPTSASFCTTQQGNKENGQVLWSTFDAVREMDGAIDENMPCGNGPSSSCDVHEGSSSSARRASQSECGSAATLPAELDDIKTGLLASSDGQRALPRMDHPSCGLPIPAGYPSPHDGDSQEEVECWCMSPLSQSVDQQQLSGSWPRDQSSSIFSVNDNFSVSRWYRELYPKSLDLERL